MKEIHENPNQSVAPEVQENAEKAQPFQYAQQQIDKNDPSTWGKIARNDPCPCGSGKKYKHCHGQV